VHHNTPFLNLRGVRLWEVGIYKYNLDVHHGTPLPQPVWGSAVGGGCLRWDLNVHHSIPFPLFMGFVSDHQMTTPAKENIYL
jgi:hypothetical protein